MKNITVIPMAFVGLLVGGCLFSPSKASALETVCTGVDTLGIEELDAQGRSATPFPEFIAPAVEQNNGQYQEYILRGTNPAMARCTASSGAKSDRIIPAGATLCVVDGDALACGKR